jgi:hypothetical protein
LGGDIEGVIADVIAGQRAQETTDVNRPLRFGEARDDALVERFRRDQQEPYKPNFRPIFDLTRTRGDKDKLEEIIANERGVSTEFSGISKYNIDAVYSGLDVESWLARFEKDGTKIAEYALIEYEDILYEKISVVDAMIKNERDAHNLVKDAYKLIHDSDKYEIYVSLILNNYIYKPEFSPQVIDELTKCISIYLMLGVGITPDFISLFSSPEVPKIGYGYNANVKYEKQMTRYRVVTRMRNGLVVTIKNTIQSYGLTKDYSNLIRDIETYEEALEEAWEEQQEEAWEEQQEEALEEAWEEQQEEALEEAWEEQQEEALEEAWEEQQEENVMDAQYKSAQVVPILRMLTLRPNNKPAQREALSLLSGLRTLYAPDDIDVRTLADALERTSPDLAQALRSKRIVATYRTSRL